MEINTDRALRFYSDSYEQAQRVRVETGERIRAVLQGRDETWTGVADEWGEDADLVLRDILAGETVGPVPILGRMYLRNWTEERELYKEMQTALKRHPAWPWLSEVNGIGPTLGCKLLARFDPRKADTPSAFWAYAGLATVPGVLYRCKVCNLERSWPVGFKVTGKHQALGSTKDCKGALESVAGPESGVRAAQPKPGRGQKAAYDQYAKKILYLCGTSFLKSGGAYEEHYRQQRAKLDREKPGWADGRKHMTALRKTEKLFLSGLWQVWREALGLPITEPYAHAHLGHDSWIDPWSMTGKGRKRAA